MGGTQTVQGQILLVAETRFRIASEAGQGLLLTLAVDATASVADLRHWYETGTPVRVDYAGQPNWESGLAKSVTPLP